MKKSLLLILSCLILSFSFGAAPVFFFCKSDGFCRLAAIDKEVFCITRQAIFKEEKKGLKPVVAFPFSCTDAAVKGNAIWLATGDGIRIFNTIHHTLSEVLPQAIRGTVSHIAADEAGNIWFTKEWEGCFKLNPQQNLQQIVKVPVTYSLAYTGDSCIWVGTNVGLYKVPVSGKEITRYAEEGIADKDLPDNLVEHLYATGNSVWAVMPDHVSQIAPDGGEAPDFESIGNKDNELYDIVSVPSYREPAFLFATQQGILFLPRMKNGEWIRTGEIHQQVTETAFHITDAMIRKPAAVKDMPVKSVQLIRKKVYFVTAAGFWSMPLSSFSKQLKDKQG